MSAAGTAQTKSFYGVFFSWSWKSIRSYRNSDHLHTNVNPITSSVILLERLQRIYILKPKQSLLRASPLAVWTLRKQTLFQEHQELMVQWTTRGCTQTGSAQPMETLHIAEPWLQPLSSDCIEHATLKDKQTIKHLPSTSRHLGGLSDQIRLYMHSRNFAPSSLYPGKHW